MADLWRGREGHPAPLLIVSARLTRGGALAARITA